MLALGTSKPGDEQENKKPGSVRGHRHGAIIHLVACTLGPRLCNCSEPQFPPGQSGGDGQELVENWSEQHTRRVLCAMFGACIKGIVSVK